MRSDDEAASIADLRGRRAAFNSTDSQSGYNAFRALIAPPRHRGALLRRSDRNRRSPGIASAAANRACRRCGDRLRELFACRRYGPDLGSSNPVLYGAGTGIAADHLRSHPARTTSPSANGLRCGEHRSRLGGVPRHSASRGFRLRSGQYVSGLLDMEARAIAGGYPVLA